MCIRVHHSLRLEWILIHLEINLNNKRQIILYSVVVVRIKLLFLLNLNFSSAASLRNQPTRWIKPLDSVYVLTHWFPFVTVVLCSETVPNMFHMHVLIWDAGIIVHHSFANILAHKPNLKI